MVEARAEEEEEEKKRQRRESIDMGNRATGLESYLCEWECVFAIVHLVVSLCLSVCVSVFVHCLDPGFTVGQREFCS